MSENFYKFKKPKERKYVKRKKPEHAPNEYGFCQNVNCNDRGKEVLLVDLEDVEMTFGLEKRILKVCKKCLKSYQQSRV